VDGFDVNGKLGEALGLDWNSFVYNIQLRKGEPASAIITGIIKYNIRTNVLFFRA
jgi:hypothetical protein